MTRILLAFIAFYRRWLSPALYAVSPGRCKFVPTCSDYAAIAIATHGPVRGSGLVVWRLLRCHPFTVGGFDPVPRGARQGTAPSGCITENGGAPPVMPREPLP